MIIDIHDVWNIAQADHEKFVRAAAAKAWEKLFKVGPPTETLTQAYAFVHKHEKEIVEAGTRDYSASVGDYDALFPPGSGVRESANAIFKKVFDYDSFSAGGKGWDAYALCGKSPYLVCPYCHIAPTTTEVKKPGSRGRRPQLDHFIGKADYPFLALSLGNLVPSCSDCNGPTMKHTINVLTDPHLYPLADSAVLHFRLRPNGGKLWSPLLKALRLPMEQYEIAIDGPAGNTAAANSLRTFQLTSRYQSFLHDAYRLAKVGKNPAWLQIISERLGLQPSVHDQLGFSIESGSQAFKNIPQGKMRMDVFLDSRKW